MSNQSPSMFSFVQMVNLKKTVIKYWVLRKDDLIDLISKECLDDLILRNR